mmetsp:Transcript_27706/g.50330  ORF Transcript_27706/g.50330 Transcript_27706/m.50330 type:complete len:301 (-) Transcript_27706:80-982(-)
MIRDETNHWIDHGKLISILRERQLWLIVVTICIVHLHLEILALAHPILDVVIVFKDPNDKAVVVHLGQNGQSFSLITEINGTAQTRIDTAVVEAFDACSEEFPAVAIVQIVDLHKANAIIVVVLGSRHGHDLSVARRADAAPKFFAFVGAEEILADLFPGLGVAVESKGPNEAHRILRVGGKVRESSRQQRGILVHIHGGKRVIPGLFVIIYRGSLGNEANVAHVKHPQPRLSLGQCHPRRSTHWKRRQRSQGRPQRSCCFLGLIIRMERRRWRCSRSRSRSRGSLGLTRRGTRVSITSG